MMFDTLKIKVWDESGKAIATIKTDDIREVNKRMDEIFMRKFNKRF